MEDDEPTPRSAFVPPGGSYVTEAGNGTLVASSILREEDLRIVFELSSVFFLVLKLKVLVDVGVWISIGVVAVGCGLGLVSKIFRSVSAVRNRLLRIERPRAGVCAFEGEVTATIATMVSYMSRKEIEACLVSKPRQQRLHMVHTGPREPMKPGPT